MHPSSKKDVKKHESIGRTLTVAISLCLVCSIVVSGAAVMLREKQVENKTLEMQRNILSAAGLIKGQVSRDEINSLYEKIDVKVISLDSGEFTEENSETFDQRKASKDSELSIALEADSDIAGIARRENQSLVYLIYDEDKVIQTLILPIRGYGLWSTLYGFIALEGDFNTVVGLGFYDHKETPGLGGEVDNPKWRASWQGKSVYDEQQQVKLSLVKGGVNIDSPDAKYQIDSLSGATLTSRGVSNLIAFWMGPEGFGPFIQNLKNRRIHQ